MNELELRSWLDGRVASHEFSGVALAARDGETLFSYAGGLAHRGHGVPNTPSTRFAVASVTKTVTAAVALRLVEDGLLGLDRPLIDVLPPEHRPAALTPAVTLHHVLSHTSGLPNYHDDADETWDSWNANWDRIPSYHMRRPADVLGLFRDLPAAGPPGERYEYCDANFILAGLAIEAASGRPFAEVATEHVLRPAGMAETSFDELDRDPPRLAVGYVMSDEPPADWRSNIYQVTAASMPDGGMIATAPDLVRFMEALLDGTLLAAASVDAMRTPQGPPSNDLEQYGYGLGLVVVDGEVTIVGHGGGDPGVSARVAHHLADRTTIVVICNQDRGSWVVYRRLATELGLDEPRDY